MFRGQYRKKVGVNFALKGEKLKQWTKELSSQLHLAFAHYLSNWFARLLFTTQTKRKCYHALMLPFLVETLSSSTTIFPRKYAREICNMESLSKKTCLSCQNNMWNRFRAMKSPRPTTAACNIILLKNMHSFVSKKMDNLRKKSLAFLWVYRPATMYRH